MLALQRALRLVNANNRSTNVGRILQGIRNLAKAIPVHDVQGWPELQAMGETLKGMKDAGLRKVAPLIRQIRAMAMAMVAPMQRAMQEPDLFTAAEDQEKIDLEQALPEGLAEEIGTEPGGYEPDLEPVTAAKKKPKTALEALDDIRKACDMAIAQKPASAASIKETLDRYFEEGVSGLGWYDNVRGLLTKYFGEENAVTFAKLLSATSPRTPVERNLSKAIQAFNKYVNEFKRVTGASGEVSLGDDPDFKARMSKYFMRSHVRNIGRAMSGVKLSGSKVDNFARALWGDADAVTLDVWMARALGSTSTTILSKPEMYEILADAIRDLAYEKGVEPRQYQAAVWTGIKKEQGAKGQTADPFDVLMDKFWEDFAQACFKPHVKIPEVPAKYRKYPLFEAAAWVTRNCKFASRA